MSSDSVTVAVDAVCYFKIVQPISSVVQVENARLSSQQLAATTLRNTLGMRSLQEILQDKEKITHHMLELLDDATEPWGIKIERVDL